MNIYYTYAFLREDGTPYYIGKGKNKRVYQNDSRPCRPPKEKSRRILLKQNLTEEEAFKHEIYMIAIFGRKDLGTGILRNLTNGGEGASGCLPSEETKEKIRQATLGEKNHSYGKRGKDSYNYGRKHSEETKKKIGDTRRGEKNHSYGKRGKDSFNYGKRRSQETKDKMSEQRKGEKNPSYGKKRSDETKKKMSDSTKGEKHPNYGKIWITNGVNNYSIDKNAPIPEGYYRGLHKKKVEKIWITNGEHRYQIPKNDPIPEGYRRGMK